MTLGCHSLVSKFLQPQPSHSSFSIFLFSNLFFHVVPMSLPICRRLIINLQTATQQMFLVFSLSWRAGSPMNFILPPNQSVEESTKIKMTEKKMTKRTTFLYIFIYIYVYIYIFFSSSRVLLSVSECSTCSSGVLFCFFQYWDLSSGLYLQPLHHPFFVKGFFSRKGLLNYFPGLASNWDLLISAPE
jgi:hypothetical protein